MPGGTPTLIVGARKLDEAKFPNEAACALSLKTAGGKAGGVNGYSCMTLAWFNEYRFRQKNGNLYSTMFIHDVNLDEAYAKENTEIQYRMSLKGEMGTIKRATKKEKRKVMLTSS